MWEHFFRKVVRRQNRSQRSWREIPSISQALSTDDTQIYCLLYHRPSVAKRPGCMLPSSSMVMTGKWEHAAIDRKSITTYRHAAIRLGEPRRSSSRPKEGDGNKQTYCRHFGGPSHSSALFCESYSISNHRRRLSLAQLKTPNCTWPSSRQHLFW